MSLLSANLIVCESVLIENTGVASAIRIINGIRVSPSNNVASFRVYTMLVSTPMDFQQHVVQVQMFASSGNLVASAPEHRFVYGNKIDFAGPGLFNLTTDFNLDLTPLGLLGNYTIWIYLDGAAVTSAPIMLRRG